jgi:hypothetical protein
MEPRACCIPLVDGPHGHSQRFRCFLDRAPTEESQLDDVARLGSSSAGLAKASFKATTSTPGVGAATSTASSETLSMP